MMKMMACNGKSQFGGEESNKEKFIDDRMTYEVYIMTMNDGVCIANGVRARFGGGVSKIL